MASRAGKIAAAARDIFGTLPNRNVRTGMQFLKKPLTGAYEARYYMEPIEPIARKVRLINLLLCLLWRKSVVDASFIFGYLRDIEDIDKYMHIFIFRAVFIWTNLTDLTLTQSPHIIIINCGHYVEDGVFRERFGWGLCHRWCNWRIDICINHDL